MCCYVLIWSWFALIFGMSGCDIYVRFTVFGLAVRKHQSALQDSGFDRMF